MPVADIPDFDQGNATLTLKCNFDAVKMKKATWECATVAGDDGVMFSRKDFGFGKQWWKSGGGGSSEGMIIMALAGIDLLSVGISPCVAGGLDLWYAYGYAMTAMEDI